MMLALGGIVAFAGASFGQSQRDMDWCANIPVPSTSGWKSFRVGKFVFNAPSGLMEVPVEGVDSYLARWEAPGGMVVEADLGTWTGHFLRDPKAPSPIRVYRVCRDGFDGRWPQLVLFKSEDGRYGAGLWWPVPGGRVIGTPGGGARVEALHFQIHSPDSAAVGEILAIARSLHRREDR